VSPTRRQRLRPIELVVMAAIVGAFIGIVVLVATRDLPLASIFAGVAFILTLLLLAMLALVETSDPSDPSEGPVLMRERKPKRRDPKD
jgi:heme A synthase